MWRIGTWTCSTVRRKGAGSFPPVGDEADTPSWYVGRAGKGREGSIWGTHATKPWGLVQFVNFVRGKHCPSGLRGVGMDHLSEPFQHFFRKGAGACYRFGVRAGRGYPDPACVSPASWWDSSSPRHPVFTSPLLSSMWRSQSARHRWDQWKSSPPPCTQRQASR